MNLSPRAFVHDGVRTVACLVLIASGTAAGDSGGISGRAPAQPLRRAVWSIRGEWSRAGAEDLEAKARLAFAPSTLQYFRFVARLEIGDHLESASHEDFQQFKPLGRFGGRRDLLTADVVALLDREAGIVGFRDREPVAPGPGDDLTAFERCLIFTLPGRAEGGRRWSAYAVVRFDRAR
jgi:hypothetical protein